MFESLDLATTAKAGAEPTAGALVSGEESKPMRRRAEVDTSAPFESVREAVDRFGGSAVWKLQLKQLFAPEKHHCFGEVELMTVGEQTSKLEMDLIMKERETLDVLKELEMTKRIIDGLKMKLQKEPSEVIEIPGMSSDSMKVHPILDSVESVGPSIVAKQSPGLILRELKQARLNLNKTTNDMAGIRASIEHLNNKIKEEKGSLEKTRERLSSNTAKASSLEEELNRATMKLQKDMKCEGHESSSDILSQIKQLKSQKEQFKKTAEAAESEVSRLTAEIKETKANIKTAEIRFLAAKKMEEAAKAFCQISSKITLPIGEYAMLAHKAQEADELSRKKIEAAMLRVEEANRSKEDLLLKVEEAAAEVETSKKALEEALNREEAANKEKLAVEAALRTRRSEHGQKRRSTHNSTKFKNSYPTHHRRDSRMLDVNGLSLSASGSNSPLGPALSIGQILSRKLTSPEECEAVRETVHGKPKVSLGQILNRRHGGLSPQSTDDGIAQKKFSGRRKQFGFTGFSLRFAGQNKKSKKKKKKKKRQTRNLQLNCRAKLV